MKRQSMRVHASSLLFVLSLSTSLDLAARDGDSSYLCEQGGASRFVEVVREPGYACRVRYTKASGATFPWSARRDADYCGPKAVELVEKLGSLGWECESSEDTRTVLMAQIERYERHIRILGNIGKRCFFYPGEAQFGNLCGDARDEAVMVYTCESGSEDWEQHLAVFLDIESEPIVMEVGGNADRQLVGYYIDRGRVVMEMQKVDPVEVLDGVDYPIESRSIECRYSPESSWELVD